MINFLLLNSPYSLKEEKLDKNIYRYLKSVGKVYEYDFKFALYAKKLNFTDTDYKFKNVAIDMLEFIKDNKLKKVSLICIEHTSPFGLYFANEYPELCNYIICYPLRNYTQESLDRRVWKYSENKGWEKYISGKYDITYMTKLTNTKLQRILQVIKQNSKASDEERKVLMMIMDYQIRVQYKDIPKKFKIPTTLFRRLDMDIESIIQLNFERKEIRDMKKFVSEDDALFASMMFNFLIVKHDKEFVEQNKKTLSINYIIGGINDIHKKEIINAIKIQT